MVQSAQHVIYRLMAGGWGGGGGGGWGAGSPKLTWKKLTERDCREWKLTTVDPQERGTWRSGVRSAMPAASQLPGKDPLMWMMPLHLQVNQKSDYDDMMSDYVLVLLSVFQCKLTHLQRLPA